MRIFLCNPPTGLYIREDRCQVPVEGLSATAIRPPIDLAYLAAVAEQKGGVARIEDYPARQATWAEFERELAEFQPSVVVVSVTTPTLAEDMKAIAFAKRLGALTVAKGAHFLTEAEPVVRTYPQLDLAIRGEYEQTFAEILMGVELAQVKGITWRQGDAVVANPDRELIADLDGLPFPARHLLNNDLYVRPDTGERQTTIQTNRGCPSQCIYCLAGPFSGKQLRLRSPDNILAELEECVTRYGIRNFFFRADTFTISRGWVLELCRKIVARNLEIKWVCNSRVNTLDEAMLRAMREAGCWLVSLGIEAGSEVSLQKMRKGITLDQARTAAALCRRVGIKTFAFFMLGFPWEDEALVRATADFAVELDSDFAEFHIAVPFPGTELFRIVEQEKLWAVPELGRYDHSRAALRTRHLSAARLDRLRKRAILRFYLRPRYVWRTLRHAGPRQWGNYLRFGVGMLKNLVFPAAAR